MLLRVLMIMFVVCFSRSGLTTSILCSFRARLLFIDALICVSFRYTFDETLMRAYGGKSLFGKFSTFSYPEMHVTFCIIFYSFVDFGHRTKTL